MAMRPAMSINGATRHNVSNHLATMIDVADFASSDGQAAVAGRLIYYNISSKQQRSLLGFATLWLYGYPHIMHLLWSQKDFAVFARCIAWRRPTPAFPAAFDPAFVIVFRSSSS